MAERESFNSDQDSQTVHFINGMEKVFQNFKNLSLYLCNFLEGQSLPVACNPTTSRNESRVQLTSASKKPLPKVMNARHLSGGKKTKETIDIQKSVEPQQIYRPAPGSMFNLLFVLGSLFLDLLTLPFF